MNAPISLICALHTAVNSARRINMPVTAGAQTLHRQYLHPHVLTFWRTPSLSAASSLGQSRSAVNPDCTTKALENDDRSRRRVRSHPGRLVGVDNRRVMFMSGSPYGTARLGRNYHTSRPETSGAVIQNGAVGAEEPGTVPDTHQAGYTDTLHQYAPRPRSAT